MRFPEYLDIQKGIIQQKSGMGAKMVSKKYRKTHTFDGFEDDKIETIDLKKKPLMNNVCNTVVY